MLEASACEGPAGVLCTSPVGPFFVCRGVRGPGGGVIGELTFFYLVATLVTHCA